MVVLSLRVRAPHESAAVLEGRHFDDTLEDSRALEYSLDKHLDPVLVDMWVANGVEEGEQRVWVWLRVVLET